MIHYYDTGLEWHPLRLPDHRDRNGFSEDVGRAGKIERRLARILGEWEDTPYRAGIIQKGVGVYCTAFVARVLDELYGREPTSLAKVPHDVGQHNRRRAMAALRWFTRQFPTSFEVEDGEVEPGDLLMTGPSGGGPGHAMIVGPRRNTVWQACGRSVHYTGLFLPEGFDLFQVRRFADREAWRHGS